MTAFDVVILSVPIVLLAVWLAFFVLRGRKHLHDEEQPGMDQQECYDEAGNHIYYDRKIIRQQRRQRQKDSASDNK